jgi:hypothetical protein
MGFLKKFFDGVRKGINVADKVADATGIVPAPIDRALDVADQAFNSAGQIAPQLTAAQLRESIINSPDAKCLNLIGWGVSFYRIEEKGVAR